MLSVLHTCTCSRFMLTRLNQKVGFSFLLLKKKNYCAIASNNTIWVTTDVEFSNVYCECTVEPRYKEVRYNKTLL